MKVRACLLIAFCAASSTFAFAGDDKELKKLEGVYILVSGELDGKPISEEAKKTALLTIKGNEHSVVVGKEVIKGTHKLDASKTPHEIDATDTEGPYKDKAARGIYKIKGDEFTVCFAAPGKDRPKEFSTKSGAHLLHVWKKK